MKIVQTAISVLLKVGFGAKAVAAMKSLIELVENDGQDKATKKSRALEQFKALGYSLASFSMNLLLELLVAKFNIDQGKQL